MNKLALILAALAAAPLAHADDLGAQLYDKKCASCHAKDGEAQTKMGAKLKIRPFSDAEVQKKFTQAGLTESVGAGIQEKKMPAFKEKLSAEELDAVVGYVLGTFKKGGAPEAAPAKQAEARKADDAKPSDAKVEDTKPAETKPAEAKPEETKPAKPSKKAKAKKSSKKSAKAAAKVEQPKADEPKPAAQ